MQKPEDCYAGMSYEEMFAVWSRKYDSEYRPNDLEAIHRRWTSLGKRIAQGPAVRLDSRRRRGQHVR